MPIIITDRDHVIAQGFQSVNFFERRVTTVLEGYGKSQTYSVTQWCFGDIQPIEGIKYYASVIYPIIAAGDVSCGSYAHRRTDQNPDKCRNQACTNSRRIPRQANGRMIFLKIGNNKNAVKDRCKQYTEFSRPYLYKSSTQNNAFTAFNIYGIINKLSWKVCFMNGFSRNKN